MFRDCTSEAANLRCSVAGLELLRELSRNASSSAMWKTGTRCFKLNIKTVVSLAENWLKVTYPKSCKDSTVQLGSEPCLALFQSWNLFTKSNLPFWNRILMGSHDSSRALTQGILWKIFLCLCISQPSLCLVTDIVSKVLSDFSSMKLL